MRNIYLIEDSEKHWVAADVLGDALLCWSEQYGSRGLVEALNEADPYIVVNEVPGNKNISIKSEDGKSEESKPAKEWAASFDRPTLLCSTVW